MRPPTTQMVQGNGTQKMTDSRPDPSVGRLLDKRYQLVELIGQGAMGRVYRAQHVLLGGSVAVKFLSHTLLSQRMRTRFFDEAKTCAQLGQKSIHIVRVTDYGVDEDEIPFYVMEFLQGDSLSDIINEAPLAVPRFLGLARQICLGLQCAHEGILIDKKLCPIIHRDIKPSNILVTQDSSFGELAKILDFGIAKLLQEDSQQTNCFMGTLAYASPEQMEGRELDNRSDIYSLGVMMFQMLTTKMPLQADVHTFGGWYKAHHTQRPRTFESISPSLKLPKMLEHLVMACLEKQPENRPQTVEEILRAIEPLEQRFGMGRQLGQRIGAALSKIPVTPTSSEPKPSQETMRQPVSPPSIPPLPASAQVTSTEMICRAQAWPANKPIAQIVFPQLLKTETETVVTLWAMLPKQEIDNLVLSKLYNRLYHNYLCTMSPHPMLLWITGLFNHFIHEEQGPRWFRSFLDLKSPQGREVVHHLAETGNYRILLFALEDPSRCGNVISMTVNPHQCTLLKQWLVTSQSWTPTAQSSMSKDLLRVEFDRIKPKLQQELQAQKTMPPIA
ncbi:serine/threonine-protein kinase [Geitlerinema sp. PCC 7407]|uniref:serine/threonine protein kinase n=1 Tax=Geitlerinema sp. PCC 7407 TaxID=1173025 RepID=UPI00029F9037|nr:serine/threonine-protein kinase [Geitlerinema sp. PCC 7407]AFY64619.1 serine/threonine protein kinase [Geitlerinema sp. PCC 7407]